VGQPVRGRLRPARRSGLTSPDPVRTPHARPGTPPQIPGRRTPDKPQNRQRQGKHTRKAPPKRTAQPEISRWIEAKSLTLEQAQDLLRVAAGSRLYAYVVLSVTTGLRTEEHRALRWNEGTSTLGPSRSTARYGSDRVLDRVLCAAGHLHLTSTSSVFL
jgi:integrase